MIRNRYSELGLSEMLHLHVTTRCSIDVKPGPFQSANDLPGLENWKSWTHLLDHEEGQLGQIG